MKRIARLLALALGLAALWPAFAREPDLHSPLLLAANPGLSGAYGRTVLLALPSGSGTHIGVILNRPTTISVAVTAAEQSAAPVFVGGPHVSGTLVALTLAPQAPSQESVEVLPGLYMAFGNEEAVRAARQFPERTRLFAGLVAWEAGELQGELQAGAWHALEPDPRIVVRDADTLWQHIMDRRHVIVAMR